MHQIGVISDTHGLLRPEVMEILGGCEVILHAGDIDNPSIVEKLEKCKTLYAVRGNADKGWVEGMPSERFLELFGCKIYMVHNKRDISERAKDADIIICGHSHKYEEKPVDGQLFLNPGSCGKRRFSQPITMAVIRVEEKGKYTVTRRDIAGEAGVSFTGSPKDQVQVIRVVMREFDRGTPMEHIAKKAGVSLELTKQICRMYSTHPGIDVDGIINRITK